MARPPWRATGRVAKTAVVIAAWLVVVALGVCALMRVVAFDRVRVFTFVDAYTFWVYLPAYVVVVVALGRRRRALAVVGAVLVAFHLAWVIPPLLRRQTIPDAARRAPHVRVVTANLRYDNERKAQLAEQLLALDADVLLLQEVTPQWWDVLVAHGLVDRYPGRARALRRDAGGQAILSRRPLHDVRTIDAGIWPVLTARVTVGGRSLRVVDMHPVPPYTNFQASRTMNRRILALLRSTLRSGDATIAAGDCNATQYNRFVQQVEGLGLRSVHEARGRPWATTWPNGMHPVPPLRLDHVFYNRSVVGLRVREGDGTGSDHRPVIADLAIVG